MKHSPVEPCDASDVGLIPSIADAAAYEANMVAIDQLVSSREYPYIVAWGKWLGFKPDTVQSNVTMAAAQGAPHDAIQCIGGQWRRLTDITNDSNRRSVEFLAARRAPS